MSLFFVVVIFVVVVVVAVYCLFRPSCFSLLAYRSQNPVYHCSKWVLREVRCQYLQQTHSKGEKKRGCADKFNNCEALPGGFVM